MEQAVPGGNTNRSQLRAPRCRFCAIADGQPSHWTDSVLFETQSYVVIASIGAIVPGWTMVVPREHTLNLSGALLDPEFSDLRIRVAAILTKEYPACTVRFFEHGAQTPTTRIACGVDHAHLHLVPLARSLGPSLRHQPTPATWRHLPLSTIPEAVAGSEYLLYSDDAQRLNPPCWLALPTNPVSQFFRRTLAAIAGKPEHFDYREHPFLSNVASTQHTLLRSTTGIAPAPSHDANHLPSPEGRE
ncbi:MAG: hypothetical protein OXL34_18420 [Gemmatimonadota bacterium]|nr:hypothetical protein [Gemmatimonadota bacterium]